MGLKKNVTVQRVTAEAQSTLRVESVAEVSSIIISTPRTSFPLCPPRLSGSFLNSYKRIIQYATSQQQSLLLKQVIEYSMNIVGLSQ